jgi:hypothetical protein
VRAAIIAAISQVAAAAGLPGASKADVAGKGPAGLSTGDGVGA